MNREAWQSKLKIREETVGTQDKVTKYKEISKRETTKNLEKIFLKNFKEQERKHTTN